MDYSRLIPETAPEDLFACIEKECERFRKLGLGNALFDSVLSDCRHFFNRLLINHYV